MEPLTACLYLATLLPFVLLVCALRQRQVADRERYILNLRRRICGKATLDPEPRAAAAEERRLGGLLNRLSQLIEGGGFSSGQARGLLLAMTGLGSLLVICHRLSFLSPATRLTLVVATLAVPSYIVYGVIKQRQAFARQLPDAIEAITRALEAGNSTEEAMHLIAAEFPPPLGGEFGRIINQMKLGLPFKETLLNLRQRLPLPEVHYLVLALIIQRETGGQLAKILAHLAALMRRRRVFAGKLKALTAESRFTALFISGLPLLYVGYRYLFKRAEMHFFLSDPTGIAIFQLSLGLIVVGTILLKIMLRIRF